MRALVTLRKIESVSPIPGADAIEVAQVEGWKVVIKKESMKPGDFCGYFEIDSFLPLPDPRWSFLEPMAIDFEGRRGAVIRTLTLRGQVSHGLVLPAHDLPEMAQALRAARLQSPELTGGVWEQLRQRDFSASVGVTKWEAPIPEELSGKVVGSISSMIPRTGEERIQNLSAFIATHENEEFEISVKLDGESMTVFTHPLLGDGVCMRNWSLMEDAVNPMWKTARDTHLLEAMKSAGLNLAIQGELIGPGINGNKEKLTEKKFYVFHVVDIDQSRRLTPSERSRCIQALRDHGATLEQVPILGTFRLKDIGSTVEDLIAHAHGPSLNPEHSREGVVWMRLDGQASFKVIATQHLLIETKTQKKKAQSVSKPLAF